MLTGTSEAYGRIFRIPEVGLEFCLENRCSTIDEGNWKITLE